MSLQPGKSSSATQKPESAHLGRSDVHAKTAQAEAPAPQAPGDAPVRAGDLLAGKYRVDRVLGVGGMGVVVAAQHLHLNVPVALKFLLPERVHDENLVARFLQEGRAAARIRSEHVARVLDVGQLESGSPYLVLEYLNGTDLDAYLEQHGPCAPEQCVAWVLQACEAIGEAHALGLVHRDLKPANLFLTHRADGSPCIKVLDFGISKQLTKDETLDPRLTTTGNLLGSPYFMSPEQLLTPSDVDVRTDVWALGVILYQLSTGDVPFHGSTLPELCAAILSAEVDPLRHGQNVAPELQKVILTCLNKRREDRYRHVGELAWALRPLAPHDAQRSIERIWKLAAPSEPLPQLPQEPTQLEASLPAEPVPSEKSRLPRAALIAGAGFVLAALAVTGFLSLRSTPETASDARADEVGASKGVDADARAARPTVAPEGLGASEPPAGRATQPTSEGAPPVGSEPSGSQTGATAPDQKGELRGPAASSGTKKAPTRPATDSQSTNPQGSTPQGSTPQSPVTSPSRPRSPLDVGLK
jgi:serine/threonine-protein kinase